MRSVLEWAQVRALAAEGGSERGIARRLGMNRRTVAWLAELAALPRYRRASPFEALTLVEWSQIKAPRASEQLRDEYGYDGSVDAWLGFAPRALTNRAASRSAEHEMASSLPWLL